MRRAALSLLVLVVALAVPARRDRAARADNPPAGGRGEPVVGVVTGDKVNLRVGPRLDDAPVTQLEQGATVVIVERAGEWLGVQVPAGFQAAVAAALTEPVDADHVRVAGVNVNLRVKPPAVDRAYSAFRDHPAAGAVLPVIVREGDWVWVEAPEEVRAYLSAKYVKEVGPLSQNSGRVAEARLARAKREEARSLTKRKTQEAGDDQAVRDEVGAVAAALVKLRSSGGYDTAPVAVLADRLDSGVESHPSAAPRTKALAKALADDLDREMQIRVAFADEILLKKRMGQPAPDAPKAPAPRVEAFAATGVIRWEPAPGW